MIWINFNCIDQTGTRRFLEMEASEYIPISKVDLLHAGDAENAKFTQTLKDCIEDKLQNLDSQVNVKLRFKKEDNVAEEVLQAVLKVEKAEEDRRAVIIISPCLCEVMKNNKERSQDFQNKILEDLLKPRDKRQFALLPLEGVHLRDAFSQKFVDHCVECGQGVLEQDGSSLEDRMPEIIHEILRQWLGEAPNSQMEVASPPRINTVRIVHGGAKTTVREIGKELENGFMLEESSRYKLYNRVLESHIPEVVCTEIREFVTSDGPNGLCLIVWCDKLFRLMSASQNGQVFEDLVSSSDSCRLVHLCLGVSEYKVKAHFTKLTGMVFLQLDIKKDGGVVVENLTPRVEFVLTRPPSSADRQFSEVSEPEALASEESQRPRLLVQQPPLLEAQPRFQNYGGTLGLVGNPSNQNPQGGRVVLPAGNSFSMSSAGYASHGNMGVQDRSGQGNNGKVQQAQPTDSSSLEGQNGKYVANSGNSFNLQLGHVVGNEHGEAIMKNGIGSHIVGSYNAPDISGNNNSVQRASLDGANASSSVGTSQMYLQASSSGSSTKGDRYLADGEHSMPLTSISSGNFGSQEPVLPSRDMTVESPSNPGFPVLGMTSGNSQQYLPSKITSYPMSPGSSQVQFSGAPSSQPPTNRWAPNNFPSTEMEYSASTLPNEAVRKEADFQSLSNLNCNPYSIDESQRPCARKVPRRGEAGDSSVASKDQVLQRGFASLPSMSFVNNLSEVTPHCQPPYSMSNNVVSCGPSSLPFYSSSSNNVTASRLSSLPGQQPSFPEQPSSLREQSANNFNVSGLANALASRPAMPGGVAKFVQCTADGEGAYPSNQPSQDAFKQQDYREIGQGQNLPNRQIGAQFMSNPAGQRCGEETNGGERADTTPGGLGQTARELGSSPNPADLPIKDMDYRCRRKLIQKLDPDSLSGNNWKAFAYHFDMKHDEVRYMESKKTGSYTDELLNWLSEKKPDVTCGMFKVIAKEKQRHDVVKVMEKFDY